MFSNLATLSVGCGRGLGSRDEKKMLREEDFSFSLNFDFEFQVDIVEISQS